MKTYCLKCERTINASPEQPRLLCDACADAGLQAFLGDNAFRHLLEDTMPASKISITIGDVLGEIDARGERGAANRSGVIDRDLTRYYEILRYGRQSLRERLSTAEISAILDNLNGVWLSEPVSIRLIHANVADGLEEGLAEKWKIDGPALVEKLKSLTFAESCALADAVERWWNRVGNSEQPEFAEALL